MPYNRMNSIYVKGFIDISGGGIIIRQGSQFQGSDSSFYDGITSGIQNQFNSISGQLQTQILYNQFNTYGKIFSFSNFGQYTNIYFTKSQNNTVKGDIICSSYSGQYVYFVATNVIYSSQNYGITFTQNVNTLSSIIYYTCQTNYSGQYVLPVSQGIPTERYYISSNYGVSYPLSRQGNVSNYWRWGMSITMNQSASLIVVSGGGGSGLQNYYSTNYGSTWTVIGGIYNRPSSIIYNNSIISIETFNKKLITINPLSSTIETLSGSFTNSTRICTNLKNTVIIVITSTTNYWISYDALNYTARTGFPVGLLYIKFVDEILFANSLYNLYQSTDYGITWTTILSPISLQCFSTSIYGMFLNGISGQFYEYNANLLPNIMYLPLYNQLSNGYKQSYITDLIKFDVTNSIIYLNGAALSTSSSSSSSTSNSALLSSSNSWISTNSFSVLPTSTASVFNNIDLTTKSYVDGIIPTLTITQSTSDNSTNIASTAFVKNQNYLTTVPTQTVTITQATSDNSTDIASTAFVKNQSYLTTIPTQTVTITQATSDNSTNIASTTFVKAQGSSLSTDNIFSGTNTFNGPTNFKNSLYLNGISQTVLSYLSGVTSSIQNQLNALNTYRSGEMIRTFTYGAGKSENLQNYGNLTAASTDIFVKTVTSSTTNTSWVINFDTHFQIIGGSGTDYYFAEIFISVIRDNSTITDIISNKIIRLSFDNQYSTITLFPLFGTAFGGTSQTFTVRCGLINADDPLWIDNSHWACTISEIQN